MGQIKNIKLHIVTDIKYKKHQNGQIKESYRPQPNSEEPSKRYQKTTPQQVPFIERCRPKVPQKSQVRQETQQMNQWGVVLVTSVVHYGPMGRMTTECGCLVL